ncbi:MAG: phage tail tip lysozyme [Janthinobacterium lividum]
MNIIDALVVQLSMDTTKFKAGQVQTAAGLKTMSEGASKTAQDIAALTSGMAAGFTKVRNELLGLVGLFTAGRSFGALAQDIQTTDATLGRLSKSMGVATSELSALEGAVQRNGGSADEAASSYGTLSDTLAKFKAGLGDGGLMKSLGMLGVDAYAGGKLKDTAQLYNDIADAEARIGKTDPQRATSLGMQIPGMTPGMLNLLRGGSANFQAELQHQRELGTTSPQDAANAQALHKSVDDFEHVITTFARHLQNDVTPVVTQTLAQLDAYLMQHLPAWERELDDLLGGLTKWLGGDWGARRTEFEGFADRTLAFFDALGKWQPPGWASWLAKQAGVDLAGGTRLAGPGGTDPGTTKQDGTSRSVEERGQLAMDYLVAKGERPIDAAAAVGNAQRESSLDPRATNATGHSGLFGWSQQRQGEIAAQFGKPFEQMGMTDQLDAYLWELRHGKEQAAGRAMSVTNSVADAARALNHGFERSVNDGNWAPEDDKRVAFAEQHMARFPGAGKRRLDWNGGFMDGFFNHPPELSVPPKPYVAGPAPVVPPHIWAPLLAPAPLRPGQQEPAAESPDFTGLGKWLKGSGVLSALNPTAAQPTAFHGSAMPQFVPTAAERWGSTTNNTAHHSTTEIKVGAVHVHTQGPQDAKGIAGHVKGELEAMLMTRSANRGLG